MLNFCETIYCLSTCNVTVCQHVLLFYYPKVSNITRHGNARIVPTKTPPNTPASKNRITLHQMPKDLGQSPIQSAQN